MLKKPPTTYTESIIPDQPSDQDGTSTGHTTQAGGINQTRTTPQPQYQTLGTTGNTYTHTPSRGHAQAMPHTGVTRIQPPVSYANNATVYGKTASPVYNRGGTTYTAGTNAGAGTTYTAGTNAGARTNYTAGTTYTVGTNAGAGYTTGQGVTRVNNYKYTDNVTTRPIVSNTVHAGGQIQGVTRGGAYTAQPSYGNTVTTTLGSGQTTIGNTPSRYGPVYTTTNQRITTTPTQTTYPTTIHRRF